MANEIIRDKLLSTDGKLTLMVLALDPAVTGKTSLAASSKQVRAAMDENIAGTGLKRNCPACR